MHAVNFLNLFNQLAPTEGKFFKSKLINQLFGPQSCNMNAANNANQTEIYDIVKQRDQS